MDKQHLTATISALLGAGVLVAQAAGVHVSNFNVQASADAIASLLVVGGTVWAAIVHQVSRKPVVAPVAVPAPAPAPVAPEPAPAPVQAPAQAYATTATEQK